MKVTVGLDPPLKNPIVQTTVKDCSLHFFISSVLKKYRKIMRKQGVVVDVHTSNCAVDARVRGIPAPLPIDRKVFRALMCGVAWHGMAWCCFVYVYVAWRGVV